MTQPEKSDTSILWHRNWRRGWHFRREPVAYQCSASIQAVDASGALFGFGVGAGTQETAEKLAQALLQLLIDGGFAEAPK